MLSCWWLINICLVADDLSMKLPTSENFSVQTRGLYLTRYSGGHIFAILKFIGLEHLLTHWHYKMEHEHFEKLNLGQPFSSRLYTRGKIYQLILWNIFLPGEKYWFVSVPWHVFPSMFQPYRHCLQWVSSDCVGSIIVPWRKSPYACNQWHTRRTGGEGIWG